METDHVLLAVLKRGWKKTTELFRSYDKPSNKDPGMNPSV